MRRSIDMMILPVFPVVFMGEVGQASPIVGEALTAVNGSEVDSALSDALNIVSARDRSKPINQRGLLGLDRYLIGMELIDPDIGSGGLESIAAVSVDARDDQGVVISARLATWEKTGGDNPLFSHKGLRVAALLRYIFAPARPLDYEIGAAVAVDDLTLVHSFNPTPGYPSRGWYIRDLGKFLNIQGRECSDAARRASAYTDLVVDREGKGHGEFHPDDLAS